MQNYVEKSAGLFSTSATGIKFWARAVGSDFTLSQIIISNSSGSINYTVNNVTITAAGGWVTIPYSSFGISSDISAISRVCFLVKPFYSGSQAFYIDDIQSYGIPTTTTTTTTTSSSTTTTTTSSSDTQMWENFNGSMPTTYIYGAGGHDAGWGKIVTASSITQASVTGYNISGSSMKITPGQNTYAANEYQDMQNYVEKSAGLFSTSATGIKFWARAVGSDFTLCQVIISNSSGSINY